MGSVKLFPNLEDALKGVFNRVVTNLGLSDNNIGPEGAITIAEALKVNAVLTELRLFHNNIGDNGAKAIAEALKVNAVLTVLYLGENIIGDNGAKAIAEALKVNAVLTKHIVFLLSIFIEHAHGVVESDRSKGDVPSGSQIRNSGPLVSSTIRKPVLHYVAQTPSLLGHIELYVKKHGVSQTAAAGVGYHRIKV